MEKASSDPMPARTLRVTVSARSFHNAKTMQEITARVLERIGCPSCHSGRDLRFQLEEDLFAVETAGGDVRIVGLAER